MKTIKLTEFFFFYIKEVILSNLRIAWDVLTPAMHARPAFLEMPLEPMSDLQITLLANLITMTPGTLSIDVSPDRSRLMIHCMYVDDEPSKLIAELKSNFERRVIDVF